MPTILFGIIFYVAPEAIPNLDTLNQGAAVDLLGLKISIKLGLVLLIFNFTFLLPAYLIYVLYRFGAIQSLEMQNVLKDCENLCLLHPRRKVAKKASLF